VKNGIDVFRVFDALNDIRNLEFAIKVAKEYKAHVQGTICYTISPVHTVKGFADMAEKLEHLGCDSICIKDMAGLIAPQATMDLVKAIKKRVKIPVDLHSHCSSGMAPLSYHAAALAGVNILDTTISVFGWGTSQPPTESIVAAFKGTRYDTKLDLELLNEINEYFVGVMGKYKGLLTAQAVRPDINVLLHQIPGGMLSNLVSQLKEQNALDRLDEVLKEVPRVRRELGYPPLVTPTSQIVGTQAVLNVLSGQRYSVATQEVKDYLLGRYGRPAGKMDEEVRRSVVGDEVLIDVRPADLIEPELEQRRLEGQKLSILKHEEDLITYALYPRVAVKFLRGEIVEEVLPEEGEETVNAGVTPKQVVTGGTADTVPAEAEKKAKAALRDLLCPMPGTIVAVKVKVGDRIKNGDVVVVLDSMKMQSEIHSPYSGVVREIRFRQGERVPVNGVLMLIERDGS
jgi:pyruvate carboxylase subunit B